MVTRSFRGFAGIRLEAGQQGNDDDPPVLLLHGSGETREMWDSVAEALVLAGRSVVSLDMRGHGASDRPVDGRYDIEAYGEDVNSVLSRMGARPVVVATSLGAWAALGALTIHGTHLAAALVLIDIPSALDCEDCSPGITGNWDPRILNGLTMVTMAERMNRKPPSLAMPTLVIRDPARPGIMHDANLAAMPDCEVATIHCEAGAQFAESDDFSALLLEFLERRAPREPLSYRSGSDPRTLRDALGCFATGVTIITTHDEAGRPAGLTANSFTSLSLDPPLLLVCIDNRAQSLKALEASEYFAVNVLHIGQQPASNRFASRDVEDRFAGVDWQQGETGAPLIIGSLAAFECRRHAIHEGGDHRIVVGEVVKATFEPRRDPLLFFRGRYRRLHFG